MSIELPRDADGREIPLDTVALYDDDGNAHNIRRFIYTNDFDSSDKWINSWTTVADDYKVAKPEQMHLTPLDSWEKLEEDLCIVEDFKGTSYLDGPACAYARSIGKSCGECKLYGGTSYVGKMCADIASRIRKLRGDD